MTAIPELSTKVLRRAAGDDEYRLYRAALEWDLADPTVIQSAKDLKSERHWKTRFQPADHQLANLVAFSRRLPAALLADDAGLSPTISAGLIASELIARGRVRRILIVCSKHRAQHWHDELKAKFDIPSTIATDGEPTDTQPEAGAVIATYDSWQPHLDKFPDDRFQLLILDEAQELGSLYGADQYGADQPAPAAVQLREVIEKRFFRYVLMLTANRLNRLWDLYSVVDLLAIARGHQNPFGSQDEFARKFIADKHDVARHLKPEAREEFRAVVYGYISRIGRGEAELSVPDRTVRLFRVQPTPPELRLIWAVGKVIHRLEPRAQMHILQGLASSPHALMAQLITMARNGKVSAEFSDEVSNIVRGMPTAAKLIGLKTLVDQLARLHPKTWRMVVFTARLETQIAIQTFLEARGLKVGIINDWSGSRNEAIIKAYAKDAPDCHLIISTEPGFRGVNFPAANVLVNYDLPWNPIVGERRIATIQRPATGDDSLSVVNIILEGTFEDYIVGRLSEKLQANARGIGDSEALLEALPLDDATGSFDEKVLQLVLDTLAGKDVEKAVRDAEQGIVNAKAALNAGEAEVDALFGSKESLQYTGPRAPEFRPLVRSVDAAEFTLAAFRGRGAGVTPQDGGNYLVERGDERALISLKDGGDADRRGIIYAAGSPAFARLVSETAAGGLHQVRDLDSNAEQQAEEIARRWVASLGASWLGMKVDSVRRCFGGKALIRVRASVVHDDLERLVGVPCAPGENKADAGAAGLGAVTDLIDDAGHLGIDLERLSTVAAGDPDIAEFSRFYLERRVEEIASAGDDELKRERLYEDFTPRIELSVVALDGEVHREIAVAAEFAFADSPPYASRLVVVPSAGKLIEAPALGRCEVTGKIAPKEYLGRCALTDVTVLRHLLVESELSGRQALPEHALTCTLSGKRILIDEAELSAATRKPVASVLLRTCSLTGRRAEPEHFGRCEFSGTEIISTELGVSAVSGKRYRLDQQMRSSVSGKAGHKEEFLLCSETHQPITMEEAEICEVTGRFVRPGILERCGVTGKLVLPTELELCAASGVRVLTRLLVTSSISGARLQHRLAVRSIAGAYCSPAEAKLCMWSGRRYHPDDIRLCDLTGIQFHVEFAGLGERPYLQPLGDLLNGVRRSAEGAEYWDEVAAQASKALHGSRCHVETANVSPDKRHLAICSEVRTGLGMRVKHAGILYSMEDAALVGRIAIGKRTPRGWVHATN